MLYLSVGCIIVQFPPSPQVPTPTPHLADIVQGNCDVAVALVTIPEKSSKKSMTLEVLQHRGQTFSENTGCMAASVREE